MSLASVKAARIRDTARLLKATQLDLDDALTIIAEQNKQLENWERKYAAVRRALDPHGRCPEPPTGPSLVDLANYAAQNAWVQELEAIKLLANTTRLEEQLRKQTGAAKWHEEHLAKLRKAVLDAVCL